MLSPEEDYLQECVQEFSRELTSSLPLRHHSQFYDEETIKNAAQLESKKALKNLKKKISVLKIKRQRKRDLEKEFHSQIEKKIEEFQKNNKVSKEKAELILKELVNQVFEDFKVTCEAHLLQAPDMDVKRVEKLLESGKEMAISYFNHHYSSYGHAEFCENQKRELGQKLDNLGAEMLEQHRLNLTDKQEVEEWIAVEKLKEVVQEMLGIKSGPPKVTKRIKLKKVEEIQKYLMENGGELLNGKYGEIFSELLKYEADGNLAPEVIKRWAEGLQIEVQSDQENEMETPDMVLDEEVVTSGTNELEFTEETIKEEVMVTEEEYEFNDLNTHYQEMDIEVKVEGLVVQRSSDLLDAVVIGNHNQTVQGRNEDVQIFSETRSKETLAFAEENACSLSPVSSESENWIDKIQVVSCIERSNDEETSLMQTCQQQSDFVNETTDVLQCSSNPKTLSSSEKDVIGKCSKGIQVSVPLKDYSRSRDITVKMKKRNALSNYGFQEFCSLISAENEELKYLTKVLNEFVEKIKDPRKQTESTIVTLETSHSHNTDDAEILCQTSGAPIQQEQDIDMSHMEIDSGEDEQDKQSQLVPTNTQETNDVALSEAERCNSLDLEGPIGTGTVTPTASKIPNLVSSESASRLIDSDLNVPDKDGQFQLLRAIEEGQSVESIQRMLDRGANANVMKKENGRNAAHAVISALGRTRLIRKNLVSSSWVIEILNLLEANGFNLLNRKDRTGKSPLILAMQCQYLKEDLLKWLLDHGADFDFAEDDIRNSLLYQAIWKRQGKGVIGKLMEFCKNPEKIRKWKAQALHWSARYAHASAMELFINESDVNGRDEEDNTPLHFIFSEYGHKLDYWCCLEMLMRKEADFAVKNNKGYVPFEYWMKTGKGVCFEVLMKMKDSLCITQETASSALTFIVMRLSDFDNPKSRKMYAYAQFLEFLIEEKKAKLRLRPEGESQWKLHDWEDLDIITLRQKFFKYFGRISWRNGQIIGIKATVLGKLDFHTKVRSVTVPIETVLVAMLACKKYEEFMEICEDLQNFCEAL